MRHTFRFSCSTGYAAGPYSKWDATDCSDSPAGVESAAHGPPSCKGREMCSTVRPNAIPCWTGRLLFFLCSLRTSNTDFLFRCKIRRTREPEWVFRWCPARFCRALCYGTFIFPPSKYVRYFASSLLCSESVQARLPENLHRARLESSLSGLQRTLLSVRTSAVQSPSFFLLRKNRCGCPHKPTASCRSEASHLPWCWRGW